MPICESLGYCAPKDIADCCNFCDHSAACKDSCKLNYFESCNSGKLVFCSVPGACNLCCIYCSEECEYACIPINACDNMLVGIKRCTDGACDKGFEVCCYTCPYNNRCDVELVCDLELPCGYMEDY